MSPCCCTISPRGAGVTIACSARKSRSSCARGSGSIAAETETVAWLVRHHLLLSSTAFKRDLADPKTIEDFARQVQSPERLRLLLVLTVVDIRAVGPGVWNEWKRTLLRSLYEAAEERLRLGHKQHGRSEIVEERQQAAAGCARLESQRRTRPCQAPARQLLACRAARVAAGQRAPGRGGRGAYRRRQAQCGRRGRPRNRRHQGQRLHARPRGAVLPHLRRARCGGANIIDARIHTTRDGMALDNLLVLDGRGQPYADRKLRNRLVKSVEAALDEPVPPALPSSQPQRRNSAFDIAPSVAIADRASTRTTVVEVNARDRPALLAGLAAAIHAQGHTIHSAHIATYGERAVDVFYLTARRGKKLTKSRASGFAPR